MTSPQDRRDLAASITRRASAQTYFMIRFFVDRSRTRDAFMAYAYFRWVDDCIDASTRNKPKKLAFVKRQRRLLEDFSNGGSSLDLQPEEELLRDLVTSNPGTDTGLYIYLNRMMRVMEFDARRRENLISQEELDQYAHDLAVAVTEAMHYFIGHGYLAPQGPSRYLAVTAAHITHMLRDSLDDAREGYFNIPREYLEEKNITPLDVDSEAYRSWVCSRVKLARSYFRAGRRYLNRVENLRCRLAGFAYTARFEWVLRTIERENYCLRLEYPDRKSLTSAVWMTWNVLRSLLGAPLHRKAYLSLNSSLTEINQP